MDNNIVLSRNEIGTNVYQALLNSTCLKISRGNQYKFKISQSRLMKLISLYLVFFIGFILPMTTFAQHDKKKERSSLYSNNMFLIDLHPFETAITYNSRRPYSFNDRSFWAGKGVSSSLSLGVGFESRFFSIQIAPELFYAQNLDFNTPLGLDYLFRSDLLSADLPYKLQPETLFNSSLGESTLRFHIGWFELGASTAVLSWGPGIRNQMIFGKHAPGLRHLYAGVKRPVKLPSEFGEISYKIIWAWPKNSVFRQLSRDRFMSGVNISFMPGFLKGLDVGLTRTFQSYIFDDGLTIDQLLDPFEAFVKRALPQDERSNKLNANDQMASVYLSFASLELGGKIYGEYVREDHNWDLRDAFTNPHNSRGYLLGAFKWFRGNSDEHKASILIEFVNTSGGILDQVRSLAGLYIGVLPEGHTNEGQPLGASIGPHSTSAFFGYNQYLDWGRLGFSFEKVELDEFLYFESRSNYLPVTSDTHRVNLHYTIDATINFRGLILEPRVMGIQYFNEGWDQDRDFWNWHLRLGVTYPL